MQVKNPSKLLLFEDEIFLVNQFLDRGGIQKLWAIFYPMILIILKIERERDELETGKPV